MPDHDGPIEPPVSGLPLGEAFRRYADPALLRAAEQAAADFNAAGRPRAVRFVFEGFERWHDMRRIERNNAIVHAKEAAENAVERDFGARLANGELVAIGREGSPLGAWRWIPADAYATLSVESWERSTLSGPNGYALYGVLVYRMADLELARAAEAALPLARALAAYLQTSAGRRDFGEFKRQNRTDGAATWLALQKQMKGRGATTRLYGRGQDGIWHEIDPGEIANLQPHEELDRNELWDRQYGGASGLIYRDVRIAGLPAPATPEEHARQRRAGLSLWDAVWEWADPELREEYDKNGALDPAVGVFILDNSDYDSPGCDRARRCDEALSKAKAQFLDAWVTGRCRLMGFDARNPTGPLMLVPVDHAARISAGSNNWWFDYGRSRIMDASGAPVWEDAKVFEGERPAEAVATALAAGATTLSKSELPIETRGRRAKWDWEGCISAAGAWIYSNGIPEKQVALETFMQQWFRNKQDGEPDGKEIRRRARRLLEEHRNATAD